MIKVLNTISKKLKFSNDWWEYWIDNYFIPNGSEGEYHYVNSNGATMIIPIADNGKFLLNMQYRYLNQRVSIEFPGGGKKKHLTYEENAKFELMEECGFDTGKLTYLGEYNPFNGVTNEITKIYLAEKLILSQINPDDSEEFEIIEISENEIIDKIKTGEIWDGMTLAAWSIYYFSTFRRKS